MLSIFFVEDISCHFPARAPQGTGVYWHVTCVYGVADNLPHASAYALIYAEHLGEKMSGSIIVLLNVAVLNTALLLLRTQTLVGDESYCKAMIPHYSSPTLTRQEALLRDAEL